MTPIHATLTALVAAVITCGCTVSAPGSPDGTVAAGSFGFRSRGLLETRTRSDVISSALAGISFDDAWDPAVAPDPAAARTILTFLDAGGDPDRLEMASSPARAIVLGRLPAGTPGSDATVPGHLMIRYNWVDAGNDWFLSRVELFSPPEAGEQFDAFLRDEPGAQIRPPHPGR
jgi:hypothetical protein